MTQEKQTQQTTPRWIYASPQINVQSVRPEGVWAVSYSPKIKGGIEYEDYEQEEAPLKPSEGDFLLF